MTDEEIDLVEAALEWRRNYYRDDKKLKECALAVDLQRNPVPDEAREQMRAYFRARANLPQGLPPEAWSSLWDEVEREFQPKAPSNPEIVE